MERIVLTLLALGVAWVLGSLLGRVVYRNRGKEVG